MASLKIVVTGGGGFIGCNLVERLLNEGHEVWVVDNFFSGNRRNVVPFQSNPRFHLIEHDVVEPLPLDLPHVDQIFHLACPASPVYYQHDPIWTLKTCVWGTMNALEFAQKHNARFLLTSTSEVYGDPDIHPQVEEYHGNVNCVGNRSCYDEGKRVAETMAMDFFRHRGVTVRIARIFNTYGPRMQAKDGRVVSNFIVQALKGEPITIYGDGSQTRSFCFVSDLVDGLIRLMNGPEVGPINLGNPGEYTIRQLADTIQEMVNPELKVEYRAMPSDDPKKRKPDISKAQQFLNWAPTVPLREGLRKTIDDFQARRDVEGEDFRASHQKEAVSV
eukprot:GILI01008579.1.p1 GENE.GILI01008579.1~~GILI01008579.1.p1  ORF type:complete len:332 (+),score=108.63 GILI01008579.1:41-1036(+)